MANSFDNFIAGEWINGESYLENRSPSDTSDLIGLYAQASRKHLETAVQAAREAAKLTRDIPLESRQNALAQIGRELVSRAGELGTLLSREEGKPLAEGQAEVKRAGQFFDYYAAEVLRQEGIAIDSVRPGVEIEARHEPMGVVAVISPWNFPAATASWKIAPALAFGNAVIWKPASQTPATAHALAEIISRAGLPAGAFQLLMGSGGEIGDALASHAGVNAISFTGSVATGRRIAAAAAQNLTRIQLELGSKNAVLVADDADLSLALEACLAGAYSGSGQKCTASSRILVDRAVHDEFVARLAERVAALRVGHALDKDTQVGPVVSAEQLAANLAWMEKIRASAAKVLCGGDALSLKHDGHYMSPALVAESRNDMDFNREELFAPIAAVQKTDSYEEGLAVVNDTDTGLVAAIFTASLARARHFQRHAETGCVSVNLPTAGTDYHVPFGGRKNSSLGAREQGRAAVQFYTQTKTTYSRAG
ncbi:MAG: aldehyde dehydrogenase family protein [Alphaproteobacteria bacterium]|nr:aldehyde dehydrogenase family protein [Alphaproteobacteria bacterium]